MNYKISDLCELMEELAPLDFALEWDNVGLQIGHPHKGVGKVLVTLTITPEVVERAITEKVDLIITHHPLIFSPLKNIRQDRPSGALIWKLIQNDIAVYVSHTNLDQAPQGLNQWLGEKLQLTDLKPLETNTNEDGVSLGRLGTVERQTLEILATKVERILGHPVKIVGPTQRQVGKVAVVGGSGGGFSGKVKAAGAEVLITGDVSYHHALDALAIGLCILDAGHFGTEQIMVTKIATFLREKCSNLEIIEETSANPFSF